MNAIAYFERGKTNIVLVVVLVSVAGYLAEIFTNASTYPLGQVILDSATSSILITSYLISRKKNYRKGFFFISYAIIINILISHTVFYINLPDLRSSLFGRDTGATITLIAATGFILGRQQIIIQSVLYQLLLVFYIVVAPNHYVSLNAPFFAIISVGCASIFYFIVTVVNAFITSLSEQQAELRHKNDSITSSLHYARRIQRSILPSLSTLEKLLPGSFVFYKPKDIVSGDFFFTHQDKDLVYFAVADCTGHGIPGAFVSFVCHNSLRSAIQDYRLSRTAEILDKTRELIMKRFNSEHYSLSDGMNIALCIYNKENGQLTYSGAYNDLLVVRKNGVQTLRGDRQPVGIHTRMQSFRTYSIQVDPGDWVYLYSDGFSDQFGGKQSKKFKEGPFRELIQSLVQYEGSEQCTHLERVLDEWKGTQDQVDDITVMGIRIPERVQSSRSAVSRAS